MHVTWFETEMALETIQSVKEAIKYTNLPVKVKLCFNKQTRFDTPINNVPFEASSTVITNLYQNDSMNLLYNSPIPDIALTVLGNVTVLPTIEASTAYSTLLKLISVQVSTSS